MRWWVRCGLVLEIAACALAAPAVAAQPADGPGCIGVMAEDCVRWLRATMTIDEGFLAGAMAHRHETDVNGRPIGGGAVTGYARPPGEFYNFVLLLHLPPDRTVERAETNLVHGQPHAD